MAGDYDNNMTGVLFKNNQDGNDARPWYKGFAEIQGVKYEVAAWVREAKKDGSKFLSLKFTAPDGKREEPPPPDDFPF